MTGKKRATTIAWAFCISFAVLLSIQFVFWVPQLLGEASVLEIANWFIWNAVGPLAFAVLAVLVVTRQPGNRVGWLMMIIALGGLVPVSMIDSMSAPPETLSPELWLLLWYYGWGWIPTMFPIFLIPLHFPTGRPLSPRWNWVNFLALGMVAFFVFTGTFVVTFETTNWNLPNPVGFIPNEFWDGLPLIFWFIGLLVMVISSVSSLFVRYRRANYEVRQQIKWLLFACAQFAVIYGGFLIIALNEWGGASTENPLVNELGNLVFSLSILIIPAAIGFSILRYRLYDIDLIIRRTLQYSLISGLLALVYFGGVTLLQGIITTASGEQSTIAIVISTLAIAALFNPLRRRVQNFIDRRFYRQKYDAEKALAEFAEAARSEADLAQISSRLTSTVQEALQPEYTGLWLVRPQKDNER